MIITDTAYIITRTPDGGSLEGLFWGAGLTVTGSDRVKLKTNAGAEYHFDDVQVKSEDTTESTALVYADNNELKTTTTDSTSTTYTYDDWGRTITKSQGSYLATYAYDYGKKLQAANSTFPGEDDVAYMYGGDGKRRWRAADAAITHIYNWDAGYNVVTEDIPDGSGGFELGKTYINTAKPVSVPGGGAPMDGILINQGPVGMVLAEVSGTTPATGTYRYYAQDNILSTRQLFNDSKTSLGLFEYTPFGEEYTATGPSDVTHRYTGLDWDSLTNKYFSPYRFYDPSIARWMTRDPLGMADGPNMFAYVANRPISLFDPLGLRAVCTALYAACTFDFVLLAQLLRFMATIIFAESVALCFTACAASAWKYVKCVRLCIAGAYAGYRTALRLIGELERWGLAFCESLYEDCEGRGC